MVKKVRKSGEGDAPRSPGIGKPDVRLPDGLKASAQQIWLAGMGAFSRAQAEGGKVFETLIKEGLNLQRKTQDIAEDKIQEVTGRMTGMAGDIQAKAGQQWDKLESIFEQRTAKAMAKLGVPTAKDVEALIQRVDELAAAVARLSPPAAGSGGNAAPAPAAVAPRRRKLAPSAAPTEPSEPAAPAAPVKRTRAAKRTAATK